MHHQVADPRRRRRMQIAAIASGVTTFSLILFMWVANKMSIARVDAPNTSFIMVQMSMDEPPPPPPPPPPPASSNEVEEEIPEEEVPMEEIVQPTETPEKVPEEKTQKIPGGVPGGVPGGIPGGVVGGVVGGLGGVATKRDAGNVAKKPIGAVMQQAIYAPDPDPKKLQATKAGMFDRRSGVNKTSFCVNTSGKTEDVRTVKKFPNDPKVDTIIRNTVKKWRFKPFTVGGKAQKTCATYEFQISFK